MLLPTLSSASFLLLLSTATIQFETVLAAHSSTSGNQIGGLTGKHPIRKYARTWQRELIIISLLLSLHSFSGWQGIWA